MKTRTNLGRMIRGFRLLNEEDMREFAQRLNISAATVCRLEMGHLPDAETLVKIISWMLKKGETKT